MNEMRKNNINRRDFVLGSSALAGSLALGLNGCSTTNTNISTPKIDLTKRRKIGELEVFPIGIGCMNAAWGFGDPMKKKDAVKLFRTAAQIGQNYFDTAEVYGAWLSEQMVGEALSSVRKDVIIASKVGFDINAQGNIAGLNSRPEHIKKAVEGSLKRLKTDYIDILYQHRIDKTIPIEDVAGAVQDLIKEGKVREFGLSAVGEATIRRANKVQKVAAVQNEYSIWSRDPEGEVVGVCEELGITLVPWAPLGKGFLSGKVLPNSTFPKNDRRSGMPRFTKEAMKNNWALIELLEDIAKRYNANPAQISLAWLLAKKPFIAPIPGTTKIEHLMENMAAASINLTVQDMKDIEDGYSNIQIIGKRAAPNVFKFSDIGSVEGTSSKGTNGSTPLKI